MYKKCFWSKLASTATQPTQQWGWQEQRCSVLLLPYCALCKSNTSRKMVLFNRKAKANDLV